MLLCFDVTRHNKCSARSDIDNVQILTTDETTICKGASAATYYTTAFPYDCHKYHECTQEGTVVQNKTVSNGGVYNPTNGQATDISKLTCATYVG